jgi:ATP-dependent DNA helicase RecG
VHPPRSALRGLGPIPDPVPEWVRAKYGLLDLDSALRGIHAPSSWEALARSRRRLVFDEFLYPQLRLALSRAYASGPPLPPSGRGRPLSEALLARLPFRLTPAQARALADIREDLAGPRPMARLLQGDVGSGKVGASQKEA